MSLSPSGIRLGISSCLLGQRVRYNGGDKHDAYATATLARAFTLVPICPEVAIGLGVPRPPIELHGNPRTPHAWIEGDAGRDVTGPLADYAHQTARDLADIAGYVFKSRSPSCGLFDTPIVGSAVRGRGVFAHTLIDALPALPCEDEVRLRDPRVREGFVERVTAYAHWKTAMKAGVTASALVAFHASHKFTLMAHDGLTYRMLGRVVAAVGSADVAACAEAYLLRFMSALRTPATLARHADVLMHLLGFFKHRLTADEKRVAHSAIHAYRRGYTPRREPLSLLQEYLDRYPHPYLAAQSYLDPLPLELAR